MWECGDCGQPENSSRALDRVCHHCGLLLCPLCRYVIADGAFGGLRVSSERTAVHCQACSREHHPAAVPLGSDRDR
jgi:hypothetical protein